MMPAELQVGPLSASFLHSNLKTPVGLAGDVASGTADHCLRALHTSLRALLQLSQARLVAFEVRSACGDAGYMFGNLMNMQLQGC